jgi:xylulokinase
LTPGSRAGGVSEAAAERFGLLSGVPVFVGGLDHYIAAIGAGTDTLADASESTGTVVACVFTGSRAKPLPGACLGPAMHGNYLLVFDDYGGTVLEKYRDGNCPERSFAEMDALATEVPPGAAGTTAFLDSDRALGFHLDDEVVGEGDETTRKQTRKQTRGQTQPRTDAQIGRETRAVLELTASMLRDLMLRASPDLPPRVVSTGGGARSTVWTQIKSSMIGSTFYTVGSEEPAAHGAAFLAARGTGMVTGADGASAPLGMPESWITVRSVTRPVPADREYYAEWIRRKEKIDADYTR